MSNLTEQDAMNLHAEWSQAVFDQECKPSKRKKKRKAKGNKRQYYSIKAMTAKAEFFVTYDGLDGIKGFWLPKSAIEDYVVEDGKQFVLIASWMKPEEIWWT